MRVKKLYDGKPYKLALNRDGYYELRWTGTDGNTKQLSTHKRDFDEAQVEAELAWRDYHQIRSAALDSPRSRMRLRHYLSTRRDSPFED